MIKTTQLSLPMLQTSQAQKEVTVNEALLMIDCLLPQVAKACISTDLPANSRDGDVYLLQKMPETPAAIAFFAGGWRHITPVVGMRFYVANESIYYQFKNANWVKMQNSISQTIAGEYLILADDAEYFTLQLQGNCMLKCGRTTPQIAVCTLIIKRDNHQLSWGRNIQPSAPHPSNETVVVYKLITSDFGNNWYVD